MRVWAVLGVNERWPITSEEAVAMVTKGMGYDVDAERIDDYIARAFLQGPQAEDEWNAADVMIAAGLLEHRRQWEPSPGRHDRGKSECEIGLEKLRAEGIVGDFADKQHPKPDLRQIIAYIVHHESVNARRMHATMLAVLLEAEHGVRV